MSLDLPSLSSTTSGAGTGAKLLRAVRALGPASGGDARAAVSAADISTPFVVPAAEEDALVRALRAAARAAGSPPVETADDFWLRACVRARKGDVARALPLADNYLQWRASVRAGAVNAATSETMRSQLRSGFVFAPGNVDREGRPVLNLRMRKQDPGRFSAADTTRMISFVLEWMLRTFPAAQTHGIVIVNDLSCVSYGNLDVRMPGVLQKAFSRTVPVRLASINMVNPPGFFRALFALISPILSAKFKARVRMFPRGNADAFQELFERTEIMTDLGMGGTAEWTEEMHKRWVESLVEDCQTWGPAVTLGVTSG